MACLMYKKGTSAVVRGVECDFVRIPYGEIDKYKELGYVGSLVELEGVEPEEVKEPLITEADRLYTQFVTDPEALTKAELIELGKHYGIKLHKKTLEANMIKKIKEVM